MTKPNSRGAEMLLVSIVNRQSANGHAGRGASPRVGKWMATLLALAFVLSIGAGVARAQCTSGVYVINWTGADLTTSWSDSGNWSPTCTPANNDTSGYYFDVSLGTGSGPITLDTNVPTTIDQLALGTGTTLTDNGTTQQLTIGDPTAPGGDTIGVLNNAGTINWGNGSTLTLNSSAGYSVINNSGGINLTSSTLAFNDGGNGNWAYLYGGGTITLSGGAITGVNGTELLDNENNTIQGDGTISNLTIQSGGTINANTANPLTITPAAGGYFYNYGAVNATGSGGLIINVNAGGSYLYNFGTMDINASSLTVNGDFGDNGETLTVENGSTLTVTGSFNNPYSSSNLSLLIGSNGTIGGSLFNSGAVTVDNSTLTVSNDFNNQNFATTTVQNGGTLTVMGNFNNNDYFATTQLMSGGTLNVGGTFTNQGTETFQLLGSGNVANLGGLTNQGTVRVDPGSTITITNPGGFANVDASGNLSGTWVLGGQVYYDPATGGFGVNGNQDITSIGDGVSNPGSLTLNGSSGGFFGGSALGNSYDHLASLNTVASNGTFTLENGATFTTLGNFTNNGTVNVLNSGALTVAGTFLSVDTSGNLSGNWDLNGQVFYDGSDGVNFNRDITSINGNVTLDGSSGGFFGLTNTSYNHLAPLNTVNGSFTLTNGATFTTAGGFTNNGSVSVLNGTGSLTVTGAFNNVDGSGNLTGNWDLAGNVYYDGPGGGSNPNGDITAINGSLTLDAGSGTEGGLFGITDTSHNHLALNTVNGFFGLANGATFSTPGDFTNNGTVSILGANGGGPSSLTITGAFNNVDVNGNLTGNWVLGGNVYYDAMPPGFGVNGMQDITSIDRTASLTLDGNGNNAAGGFFGLTDTSHDHLTPTLATNNGIFQLQNNATFMTSSDFANNGALNVYSGSTLTVNGNLTSDGGSGFGTNTNCGSFSSTTVCVDGSNNGTNSLLVVTGTYNNQNAATTVVQNGAQLSVGGDFNNLNGSATTIQGGASAVGGSVTNDNSMLSVNNTTLTVNGSNYNNQNFTNTTIQGGGILNLPNGTFTNDSTSVLILTGSGTPTANLNVFQNSGTVEVDPGGLLNVTQWNDLDNGGNLNEGTYNIFGGKFTYTLDSSGGFGTTINNIASGVSVSLQANGAGFASDGIGSDVLITTDGSNSALDNLSANGGTLQLDGIFQNLNGGLINTGTLNLFNGSSMTTNCAGSALCASPGATGGDLTNGGNTGSGVVVLEDNGNGSTTLTVNGNYEQNATYLYNDGNTLTVTGSFTNDNQVQVDTGSAINVAGGLTNVDGTNTLESGTFDLNGGTFFYNGNEIHTNNGSITITNGGLYGTDVNGSMIALSADGGVTSALDNLATNNGFLSLNGVTQNFSGSLTNNGNLILSGGASSSVPGAFANFGGTLEVDTGSTLTAGSWANLDPSGNLTGGATYYLNGGLFNYTFNSDGSTTTDLLNNVNNTITLSANGATFVPDAIGSSVLISHDGGVTSALDNLNTNSGFIQLNGIVQNLNSGLINTGNLYLYDGSSMTTNCAGSAGCASPGAAGGDLTNGGIPYYGTVVLYNNGGGGSNLTVNGNYEQNTTELYGGGNTLTVAGTGNSFTNDNYVEVDTGSAIKVTGTGGLTNVSGNTLTGGTFNLNGGTFFYTGNAITNIGSGATVTLNNAGGLGTDGTLSTIMLSADGGTTSALDGLNTINGTLNMNTGDVQNVSGALTVNVGGQLNLSNSSSMTTGGALTNSGSVALNVSGTLTINGVLTKIRVASLIRININKTNTTGLTQNGSLDISNSSKLIITGSGWAQLTNAGEVTAGTYDVENGSIFQYNNGPVNTIVTIDQGVSITLGGNGLYTPDGHTNALTTLATNNGTFVMQNADATLTTGQSLTNGGSLYVSEPSPDNPTTLTIGGDLVNQAGALVQVGESPSGFSGGGTLNLHNATNAGTMNVGNAFGGYATSGTVNVGSNFDNSGTLHLFPSDGTNIPTVTTATLTNEAGGLIQIDGDGSSASGNAFLHVTGSDGSFTNYNSATNTLSGGNYIIGGTFQVDGGINIVNVAPNTSLTLEGPSYLITPDGQTNGLANLASNGGFLDFNSANFTTVGDFTNTGTFQLDSGFCCSGPFTVATTGTFTNTGGTVNILGNNHVLSTTADFNNNDPIRLSGNVNVFGTSNTLSVGRDFNNTGSTLTVAVQGAGNQSDLASVARNLTNDATSTVQVNGGGTLTVAGNYTNAGTTNLNSPSFSSNGGSVTVGGNFDNSGTLHLFTGNSSLTTAGFSNEGSVVLETGSEILVTGASGNSWSDLDGSGNLTGTGSYDVAGLFEYKAPASGITSIGGGVSLTLRAGGLISTDGSTDALAGLNSNAGTLDLENRSYDFMPSGGTLANSGNLILNGSGDTITVSGNFNNSGTTTVSGSSQNLTITGTLTNSGTVNFNSDPSTFTVSSLNNTLGGVIKVADGDSLVWVVGPGASSTSNNDGSITIGSVSGATFQLNGNGSTFDLGSGTGMGTLTLNKSTMYGAFGTETFINDTGHTIQGSGAIQSLTLVNNGTIDATSGLPLSIYTGATNTGTLEATGGATLVLSGSSGGILFTNTGGTIQALGGNGSGSNSTVDLESVTIAGGTLSTTTDGTGSGIILGHYATLDGTSNAVTNAGHFSVPNGYYDYVQGTIINTGSITLDSSTTYAQVFLSADTTLQGGGTVTLSNSPYNLIRSSGGPFTLTNHDNLIQGAGNIGYGNMALNNQGTIDANQSANLLEIQTSYGVTNTGTLEATNGATLELYGDTYTNTNGTIHADDASAVVLYSNTIRGGQFTTTGSGTIYGEYATLDGTGGQPLTNVGHFSVPNGYYDYVQGTVNNTGSITLDSSTTYAQVFLTTDTTLQGGGTVTLSNSPYNLIRSSGGPFTLTNQNNTIQGVGTITANVINGGTIVAGSGGTPGQLIITGNYTQTGTGVYNELIGSSSSNGLLNISGNTTLDSGAALTINLLGGFDPSNGTTFTILDGTTTGQFNISDPLFGPGNDQKWVISYNGGDGDDVILTAESNSVSAGTVNASWIPPAGSGNWTTATQWSCTPGAPTCVPNNGGGTVYDTTLNDPGKTLTLPAGNSITVDTLSLQGGTLVIQATASLDLANQPNGITDIPSGAGLDVAGTFTAGANSALASLTSVEGNLTLENAQTTATTPNGGTLNVASTGDLRVDGGSTLMVNGDLTNSGFVYTGVGTTGNTLNVTGAFTNNANAQAYIGYSASTGDVANVGALTNDGYLQIGSGATLNITGGAQGVTDVVAGSTLLLYGTLNFGAQSGLANLTSVEGYLEIGNGQTTNDAPNGGTLTVANTGDMRVNYGSTLNATGNLTNSGLFYTGVGTSGNTLNVTGTFTNNANAQAYIGYSASTGDIANVGALTNDGYLQIGSGATLNITGGGQGVTDVVAGSTLLLYGTLNLGAQSGLGNLTSVEGYLEIGNGQITNDAPNGGTLTVANTGDMRVNYGSTLNATGNLTNSG